MSTSKTTVDRSTSTPRRGSQRYARTDRLSGLSRTPDHGISPPTTDTVSTAESFFTAFLRGDWDATNNLAQGVLISGENANLLWEIDVVSIDCELVTEFLISCTSTQTDALTRQVGTAYAWQSVGTMLLVDGVVTWYTSENQSVSFQGRYEAWLDDESPDGWLFSECTHGGYLAARCLPIYLANVEAWLATDPDLSDIEG